MKKSLAHTSIVITITLSLLFPSPSLAATSGGFLGGFFSSLYSTVVSLLTFSPDDSSSSSSPEPSASPSESFSPSYSPTTSRSASTSPSSSASSKPKLFWNDELTWPGSCQDGAVFVGQDPFEESEWQFRPYYVPANSFSSYFSKDDANNKALDYSEREAMKKGLYPDKVICLFAVYWCKWDSRVDECPGGYKWSGPHASFESQRPSAYYSLFDIPDAYANCMDSARFFAEQQMGAGLCVLIVNQSPAPIATFTPTPIYVPSPTPTPSASYSPSYSPTYSPTYTPTYTPTYSYSPSPSYSPSSTYTPTYSPSPSQTVSATPKKSSSFMASVASGFKNIIDGVMGIFR